MLSGWQSIDFHIIQVNIKIKIVLVFCWDKAALSKSVTGQLPIIYLIAVDLIRFKIVVGVFSSVSCLVHLFIQSLHFLDVLDILQVHVWVQLDL